MEFAIDPALFGVAGPSTSSTGRIREVPSLLQQHEAAKTTARVPLLSDSGSSNEDDDEDEDEQEEEEEDSSSADDTDESPSEDDEEETDEGNSAKGQLSARDKGKGKANGIPAVSNSQALPTLPPMPQPLPASSSGGPLPPLPPSMDPDHDALQADSDVDSDYERGQYEGSSSGQRTSGELDRLISAIRDTSASSAPTTAMSRGVLGQEWDRNMEEELEDLELDERTIRGRPRKKPRGRAAAGDAEPSPELRNMLGSANLAYVQGKQKEAIDILNQIIRIDPATKAAWYTLSTIHEELGNLDKAIQLRIVVAHLTKSKAETWKELGVQSRQLGLIEQAAYCYGEAVRSDRSDVESIWDRAYLLRETGKPRQAATWFAKLLKMQPHNPSILRELGPLYYVLNEVPKAVQLYQAAYDHFRSLYPVPAYKAEELQGWDYKDFELLADFLRSLRRYKEAGKVIVEGVRWLQGRKLEGPSWTSFGDDREYDTQRKWRDGWEHHPQRWCEEAPLHPLTTGLRLRLGLARLYEGRTDEAKIHFDIIRQIDIFEIPEVYGEMADAYFEKGLWEGACEVYKELTQNAETNVTSVWAKIAQCQRNLGLLQEAVESYRAVIQNEADDLDSRLALAEIYERLDMREEALELVNEVIAARRAVRRGDVEGSEESGSEYTMSGGEEQDEYGILISQSRKKRTSAARRRIRNAARRRIMTQEERLEEERAVQEAFDATLLKLQEVDRQIERETELESDSISEYLQLEWIDLASHLLDNFRTTKALFPSDGKKRYFATSRPFRRKKKGNGQLEEEENVDEQAAGIAERLHASLQDEENSMIDEPDMNVEQDSYRGVSFDDWALLTVRYAMMLTRMDDREEAQEVLRHMLTSSMMRQDAPRWQLLIFGLVACALYSQDYDGALEDLRKVISSRRMESEPLRLHQAVCHSGIFALDVFLNNNLQKYLLRMVKTIDQMALPNAGTAAGDKDDSGDEADASTIQMTGADFKVTKVNPYFLVLYGHVMACGKSYQSAIVYYLRAYELYPTNPLICLCLALAYTHRAMQRQTDNRHYQLAQALAFLDVYRKHADNQQEVQYNVARVFHQLGLADLATKHYEKVLEMVDEQNKTVDTAMDNASASQPKLDLSREAAYNLSSIYFTGGAPDLARQVVDKYLSL